MANDYVEVANVLGMSRDGWLKLRKKYIGGSDAAAAIGLNPWRSPASVWLDKRSDEVDCSDSMALKLGRYLEDTVVRLFEEETGKRTKRNNRMMVSTKWPWMLADIDREIVGEDAILECKTTKGWNRDQWADGNVPLQYQLQCHHYMAVTGAKKCYIACLIGLERFAVREIERDEETVKMLVEAEGKFWNLVKTGETPPPDGSEDYGNLLRERYKGDDPEPQDLTGEDFDVARYVKIGETINALKQEQERLKQHVQSLMGEHQTAKLKGAIATWKPTTTRRLNIKALIAGAPSVYERYLRDIPTRRFVLKTIEEDEQ